MDHFVDEVKIQIEAGKGGNGCVSFRREKYVPFGGPNGGDGGDGGNVYVQGDKSLQTLTRFKESFYYKAAKGTHGQGKNLYGKKGEDLILKVPLGTVIHEVQTGRLLADIREDTGRILLAQGGRGGKGNVHFKTSKCRAPRIAEPGEEGQIFRIRMELKILADVGLVGFPNAGKSTLIRSISNSSSEVAAYAFSTLRPYLGVVQWKDWKSFVVADIPGIIEGSALGKGRGLKFLRHIERSKMYLFTIDIFSEEKISHVYKVLRKELEAYDPSLLKRPHFVVLNKADALSSLREGENILRVFSEETGLTRDKIFLVSALKRQGLDILLREVGEQVQRLDLHDPLQKAARENFLEENWNSSPI